MPKVLYVIYRQNRQNRQTSDTEEGERVRFGVGEIGLRRERGQNGAFKANDAKRNWVGQVRLEEIDSPKAAQNGPQSRSAARW